LRESINALSVAENPISVPGLVHELVNIASANGCNFSKEPVQAVMPPQGLFAAGWLRQAQDALRFAQQVNDLIPFGATLWVQVGDAWSNR